MAINNIHIQRFFFLTQQLQIYDPNHNYRFGDVYSDEKQILRNIVDTLENSVTLMVEFMRCIPGFTQLHLQDQSELLKGNYIAIHRYYNVNILYVQVK
jgi:hypothetical protein